MCEICLEHKNYAIASGGCVYLCKCGHFRGWDKIDYEDWQTRYYVDDLLIRKCHNCFKLIYHERIWSSSFDIMGFTLGGAL